MIYELKKYGDPILREKSTEVEVIDEKIQEILNNMVETMYETKGVGLAAPQVGFNKRMFVADWSGEGEALRKVINPVITPLTEELIDWEEGCLSVPGIYKKVERPKKVRIEYLNEKGDKIIEELEGFPAIVVQHEFDHLDAVLFVDRVSPMAKRMISKKLQALKKETLKNLAEE